MSKHLRPAAVFFLILGPIAVSLGTACGQATSDDAYGHDQPSADARWPRRIITDDSTITIYQPQVEKWERNQLQTRAAVSVEDKVSPRPTFGVIWITARTDIDKEHRVVLLNDISVTKANFPTAEDAGKDYLAIIRKNVPLGVQTVSLDRLQASMAVNQAESKTQNLPLKNEPPRVIVSNKPAILILVDGQPALRQVDGTNFLRIINTRPLILLNQGAGKYYLHLLDRWVSATALDGTWSVVDNVPAGLETAKNVATSNQSVDLLDDLAPDLQAELEDGRLPVVYVSTVPAELIETQGQPQFSPIDGTQLLYVTNTSSQVLLDTSSQNYYVLLSGRWFRSKSLDKGPWQFVAANELPADIAKIPETHPKGDVLSSVAGTPQSREAVIANQVPQTATIKRSDAKFTPVYDGQPQFQPIDGTKLSYAANTASPVIQVDPNSYYGCDNGVWFNANAAAGPWSVATSVPPAIYTIPPSSPISYVTNVEVYGSTPEVVYVGYTPGYYGTYLSPFGTVVYGSGWNFAPWVGRYWYGRPWTYGWGVGFGWSSGSWGFGFGAGVGRPWWGPVGWNSRWGGDGWRRGWENGWGGRYNNVHNTQVNFNHANVYNRWGDNVHVNNLKNAQVAGKRTTNIGSGNVIRSGANVGSGNIGSGNIDRRTNNVFAGNDGNVYRRNNENWEKFNNNKSWESFRGENLNTQRQNEFNNTNRNLNREFDGRRAGEANANQFRNTGGFGGYQGNAGGYRGGVGGGGGVRGGGGGRRR